MISTFRTLPAAETLANLPALPDAQVVDGLLFEELRQFKHKIIVLDDDPTGVQTVHGVSVYTDWTAESIEAGFKEEQPMFFILTNSRGFTSEETRQVHEDIAATIQQVSDQLHQPFILISRGDSTLRGHYPLETEVLRQTLEQQSNRYHDGEIIMPFFQEGGRYTIEDVHYVLEEETLVPAGQTEFAKDRTFGYAASHLGEWAEEKSNGVFQADDVVSLSLADLRQLNLDQLVDQLMNVHDFNKIIINATDYVDVKVATIALIRAMNAGKRFMFRTAAAFTKVIGGVTNRPLLTKKELISGNGHGGLIMIGSHVKKTTEQLEELKTCPFIHFIEFNVHLVLFPDKFREEIKRIITTTERLIQSGQTVAVYTKRERLDLGDNQQENELKLSIQISDAVTSIVSRLHVRPSYIIAKGGITSSDIGTTGLQVKRATVAGQIKPGIPVWITGEESKFPNLTYVIFPGNVGSKTTLREVAETLHT
ncbi:hydroxyacid dehydrogenase [Exiguobacterium sp. RIT452]|uniref:four-carbon acid sugar kinase family protein n=1 Tax=Exiguobacterium sp. RIT452 TaxID=2315552 RepID=UPI000E752C25|nr:four-carbon acid sugar kinase family protein [Exiguobacterium sp. RIT452]RJO96910.1 hydroxyacid dehydrogenase [Exiguobacterium sp. RIT452]